MDQPLLPVNAGNRSAWDQALYAFLVEKGNRSGSRRTVESYSRMLWPFFAARSPDQVTPADVLSFAHGVGLSGRPPSPNTIGARIGCLSSFYRFAIRMGLLTFNPCDPVERPRTQPAPARGYSADEVRRLLAVVPDTVPGRRDRAILLTLVLTGRRRSEVLGLTAGDITFEGEVPYYAYRGQGGKRGRRELSRPAFDAIAMTIADVDTRQATTRVLDVEVAISSARRHPFLCADDVQGRAGRGADRRAALDRHGNTGRQDSVGTGQPSPADAGPARRLRQWTAGDDIVDGNRRDWLPRGEHLGMGRD